MTCRGFQDVAGVRERSRAFALYLTPQRTKCGWSSEGERRVRAISMHAWQAGCLLRER